MGRLTKIDRPSDWSVSAAGRCLSSLGDVLAEVRPQVSAEALSEKAFGRLMDSTATLPAGAATHEFWLELRPQEPDRADLIFAVIPGRALARDMIPWCRTSPSPAMRACGEFFAHGVQRQDDVPGRIGVEIDVLERGVRFGLFAKAPKAPGFPDGAAAARSLAVVTGTKDLETILDWQIGAGMVTGFVGPVLNIGGFPERENAPLRLHSAVNDCDGASDALDRLGWEGDLDLVEAFEDGYPFADAESLNTDYRGRALGPVAGLERGRPGGWTEMNPGIWAERLRWAAGAGWCDREQADAWTSLIGSRVVETDAGPTTLNLGINHMKFVFGDGGGDPYMKLYVGGNMGQIRSAA